MATEQVDTASAAAGVTTTLPGKAIIIIFTQLTVLQLTHVGEAV